MKKGSLLSTVYCFTMSVEYKVEGSGPPFVYVCGIEGSGRLFYKQSDDIKRDHTVISFPLRGEGRYEMSRLVQDLAQLLRAAGGAGSHALRGRFAGRLPMRTPLAAHVTSV